MSAQTTEDKDGERILEQAYFDTALEHRERRRELVRHIPEAAGHRGDARSARKHSNEVLDGLRGPAEAVAFGRIDLDPDGDGGGGAETYYLGYNTIWDEDTQDVLVVNWQAPVASPYYTATHKEPQSVARKRSYRCEDNRIVDFDEVILADLAAWVAALVAGDEPEMDDSLLRDLGRNRTGEMQEIVRTIQAAQYEIVRAPFDQLLVVQGGPGTGKTAVALHRVSWLLYNERGLDAPDVLVVGPNPTFVRYIRSVLPTLGDRDVRHVGIDDLGAVQVRMGRVEDAAVTRLKGDGRMAGMLDRALQQRIRVPEEGVSVGGAGRVVRLTADEMTVIIDGLRGRPYASGRVALRERLRSLALGASNEAVENLLDRVWPNLTAPQFLQELLGSQNRLLEAAGEDFSAREVQVLYRQAAQKVTDEIWAAADAPLLDHAFTRISDQGSERFAHIVVDEAQDLSPMQLAMLARRSMNGSMTVVGDVAQSTGPWARDDWTDVVAALGRAGVGSAVEELAIGYRVPRPAFELAVRVLGDAAPAVRMPRVVRDGPEPVSVETTAGRRADEAVRACRSFAADGHLVGVVCPDDLRPQLVDAFATANVRVAEARRDGLGAPITIVSPTEAKGLEFDAVVVVEPAAIEADGPQGRRQLFIALTRTTGHLAVVHAESFAVDDDAAGLADAAQGTADAEPPDHPAGQAGPDEETHPRVDAAIQVIARHFATEIRSVVRAEQVEAVLVALSEELRSR